MRKEITVGILSLQGSVAEHERSLKRAGIRSVLVNDVQTLCAADGLILPGGESTTLGKLLRLFGILEPLKERIEQGMPVFGTCAGLILLAKKLTNDENVWLAAMNVSVRRNAYGRQLGSFRAELDTAHIGAYPAVFIRAPYIESAGEQVEVLAVHEGKIVAARQENMLATAFHPELTSDLRIHEYFCGMVRGAERA